MLARNFHPPYPYILGGQAHLRKAFEPAWPAEDLQRLDAALQKVSNLCAPDAPHIEAFEDLGVELIALANDRAQGICDAMTYQIATSCLTACLGMRTWCADDMWQVVVFSDDDLVSRCDASELRDGVGFLPCETSPTAPLVITFERMDAAARMIKAAFIFSMPLESWPTRDEVSWASQRRPLQEKIARWSVELDSLRRSITELDGAPGAGRPSD